jgi:hypothetical protein
MARPKTEAPGRGVAGPAQAVPPRQVDIRIGRIQLPASASMDAEGLTELIRQRLLTSLGAPAIAPEPVRASTPPALGAMLDALESKVLDALRQAGLIPGGRP